MPRVTIKECYRAPYQKTQSTLPSGSAECHDYCNKLHPYDSWGTIRYPNRLLHDSCHVRCNQQNPGYEHFPEKDVKLIEGFGNLDVQGMASKMLKYMIEGIAVAAAAYYIPSYYTQPDFNELFQIAVVAALTFMVLDMYAPAIGSSARQGAGFGMGAKMVKFP